MVNLPKVKIFCIHYKNNYIFETDAITPIQVSKSLTDRHMNMLQTCSGENISDKNDNYAEMAAWYWVWKNYMPEHKNIPYIGFCHYRRFLNYCEPADYNAAALETISLHNFLDKAALYNSEVIYQQIKDYDVVLLRKVFCKEEMGFATNIEAQYLLWHPQKDLEIMKSIIRSDYPEYCPTMQDFLSGDSAYFCLQFTMKRELVDEFLTWAFDILFKMEKICNWHQYTDFNEIRVPAFLMERFFNIWLAYNKQKRGLKILERKGYILDIPTEIYSL